MTSPADIAARLTPAQVRALKDPDGCDSDDYLALEAFEVALGEDLVEWTFSAKKYSVHPLGMDVLAELERMGK